MLAEEFVDAIHSAMTCLMQMSFGTRLKVQSRSISTSRHKGLRELEQALHHRKADEIVDFH